MANTEVQEWLEEAKKVLEKRTGRTNIEVTGGPYRSYDVSVSEAEDGHPVVDFYSVIRYDGRAQEALDYAVGLIKDWAITQAEHQVKKEATRPTFEKLQAMFPDLELEYSVISADEHRVWVEKVEGGKVRVGFDLWPDMTEDNVQQLAGYIRQHTEELKAKNMRLSSSYYI